MAMFVVVVVVGAVVGIEIVVHELDIVSAYAHNDNSQSSAAAVGSAPELVVVDPVSAVVGTVEAGDGKFVLAHLLEKERESG